MIVWEKVYALEITGSWRIIFGMYCLCISVSFAHTHGPHLNYIYVR